MARCWGPSLALVVGYPAKMKRELSKPVAAWELELEDGSQRSGDPNRAPCEEHADPHYYSKFRENTRSHYSVLPDIPGTFGFYRKHDRLSCDDFVTEIAAHERLP